MKTAQKTILTLTAAISGVVAALILHGCNGGSTGGNSEAGKVFDQVVDSKRLKVGYINYPPGCSVDPNSGEVSGIFPDALRAAGHNLGLEIDYSEEVGWDTLIEGLEAGKYDVIGSPVWANTSRGMRATFTKPLYFSGIGIWTRGNDDRFAYSPAWQSLNKESVRMGAMDGSTPVLIAQKMFPNAELVTFSGAAGESQVFLELQQGKIDIFFAEPAVGLDYLSKNPGSIKNIASDRPLKFFPTVMLVKKGEYELKEMLDSAIDEIDNSGELEQIISKYESVPGLFLRRALPYNKPTNDSQ